MGATRAGQIKSVVVLLIVDCSTSMQSAMPVVDQKVPEMRRAVDEHPLGHEVTRMGVVTFDARAKLLLPISRVTHRGTLPHFEATVGVTNYGAAFRLARQTLNTAISALDSERIWRPIVFFVSDGQPWENNVADDGETYFPASDLPWTTHLAALHDPAWRFRPKVRAFGFGDVRPETLARVAPDGVTVLGGRDPIGAMGEILDEIFQTVLAVSGGGRHDLLEAIP